ncbi:MAG: ImmA/IrrE family metallo-endopeptidase [Sphingomicrobium sp.]|nr:XRE family transcriptional regulator [Sphingomonadales bacterium]
MNAEAAPRLPYNGDILRWARLWRGKTVEDAAQRLQTKPENILAWEDDDGAPTVRQARMLAEFYGRSFLEFFLPVRPKLRESTLVPDYRLHRDAPHPNDRELWHIQRWAESKRLNAIDLYQMLGDEPPTFPQQLAATVQSNPERLAEEARKAAGFTIWQQLELKGSDKRLLPSLIRAAFERLGVLVLRRTDLGNYGARGISIAEFPLPTIVYGKEAPAGQSFTLAHEFGHMLLRQSAISGPPSARDADTPPKAVERWCDEFAAAFLIPAAAMAERWAKPNAPMPKIGDDSLESLASAFRVSEHAMLIRLIGMGYVDADYYWNVKRPEFLAREEQFRSRGGIAPYYGTRFLNSHGNLYTGLVLEAWSREAITNDSAARFLDIKNLVHLDDIRREFRP